LRDARKALTPPPSGEARSNNKQWEYRERAVFWQGTSVAIDVPSPGNAFFPGRQSGTLDEAMYMSTAIKIRHPYGYTLNLLRFAIEHLPPTFSEKKRKAYTQRLDIFVRDTNVVYADIQRTIAEIGRESWPYRKAYEDMYGTYGRASEEAFLLERLDRGIREKYEKFIYDGGKINYVANVKSVEDLKTASPFERYFTPEEKFAIEQALLAAQDNARVEINSLVTGHKRGEYDALVDAYKKRQRVIAKKIGELFDLADVSPKWKPAILDETKTLEEGWSVLERGVNEERLDHALEYWKGTLRTFLHA
jgi:hypothetical protein